MKMVVNNSENKFGTNLFVDKQTNSLFICPNCCSEQLKVRMIKRNNKCYYCKNCKKFTENPIELNKNNEKLEWICPCCKFGKLVRNGTSSNGKKVYFCSTCSKHTINPIVVKKSVHSITNITCSKCQSDKLKRKGFDELGKQLYYCFNCKKRTVKVNNHLTFAFVESQDDG